MAISGSEGRAPSLELVSTRFAAALVPDASTQAPPPPGISAEQQPECGPAAKERKRPLARPLSSADSIVRPIHVELEPRDDPRIVPGRKLGNPRGDPGVVVLRIGDDV